MREVKKRKDKVALALVLCFCVVALTSVFAVKSSLDKFKSTDEKNVQISKDAKTETQQEAPAVSETMPVVDSKENTAPSAEQKSEDFIAPVEGKIIMKYSMDMPIYSKTLDQYMTHPGVDIQAPLNSEVKAIAGGTVTKATEDDRYGMMIEIDHGNGIISTYSNLADTNLVELGDVIKQGDIIGSVGKTALFESMEPAHVHLEMTRNSAYINPTKHIKSL